ncbi:MAG: RlpA-like double-psi beta-barrel domain-containing protein [Coriobacteriia bacterium]|nr:RlpA-like double-psi beta-barrel domain-containing protein [Coriobacteriia bacterium]
MRLIGRTSAATDGRRSDSGATLTGMRLRPLIISTLVAILLIMSAGVRSVPALAEPLAEQVAIDRAALDRAIAAYETAQEHSVQIDAQVAETTTSLDEAIAEQQRCETYLNIRVMALYRTGQDGYLTLLFTATSLPELSERLDLLTRIALQDARTVRDLKAARAQVEADARSLLETQEEQARALEDLEAEAARARVEFAASEAALKQYEERRAAAAAEATAAAERATAERAAQTPASATAPDTSPPQSVSGTGDWQTGVASHYSRTFTGRGASGEAIGPYTMMVAHKTLPFGTLVEFEYQGHRAVASVEDRGPYTPGRDWDLGPGVVRALDFNGVHEVSYRIISR